MFDLEQISSRNKFQHLHFHCEHSEGQNRLEPARPRVGTSLGKGRGGEDSTLISYKEKEGAP